MIIKNEKKYYFLGPKKSYSYYALKKYLLKKKKKINNTISCKSFLKIAKFILKSNINYGIFPIKNSSSGKINETLKIIKKYQFKTIDNLKMKINHNLLSTKKNISLCNINTIYTHSQPFLQCKNFINKKLKNSKIIYTNSSTEAMKIVQNINKKNIVAIGGKKGGIKYNLFSLYKNISNKKKNITKFIIVKKNYKK